MQTETSYVCAEYVPIKESVIDILDEGKTNSYVFVAPEVVD